MDTVYIIYIVVNELSEAVEAKWLEANKCFTQPLIVGVYKPVQNVLKKYLKMRKIGRSTKCNDLKFTTYFKKCNETLLNLLACK